MIPFSKFILIFSLFIISYLSAFSQSTFKTKTEQQFSYVGNDSFPKYLKKWEFDKKGLLIERQEFHYSTNPKDPKGTLWRDEKMTYDSLTKLYTLKKTQFATKNKEPQTETYKALYLVYDNDPAKSKPIWTKTLDDYGDYLKEDTFTYDKNKNLVEVSAYNYQNSTSLFSDKYTYNKKNQRTSWRTYYHWSTVNIKGDVVNKKERRRLYRYKYNSDGNLVLSYGKFYKTRFRETRTYDDQNRLLRLENTQKQRTKNSKKTREQTKKRYTMNIEKHVSEYQNGKMILDIYTKNGDELRSMRWDYKDSLLVFFEQKTAGKLTETRQYEYNEKGITTSKLTLRYDANGASKFSVRTTFDDKGHPIEEVQLSGENTISTMRAQYDERGNIISSSLFLKTDVKYEKTLYFYTYY